MLYAPLSPAFPFWLHRAIREFRPDLLHLPNTSAFWALAVPAARQLPWVIHWHADVVVSLLGQAGAAARRERFGIEPVAAAVAALYRRVLATP